MNIKVCIAGALVLGSVACGAAPSDGGEATSESTAALTTPQALRFWIDARCVRSHGQGQGVTPEDCFHPPNTQLWAFEASHGVGFTIQGVGGCLTPSIVSTNLPPIMQPCFGQSSQDWPKFVWQIPGAPQGTLPTQIQQFELRSVDKNMCLTRQSTGGGNFALRLSLCNTPSANNENQMMMLDTF